ncbi:MAG: hypothetical protein LBN20_02010 [Endomicrobium sp.]|nr:hypothetical protein [Endomicrobium sp.]
MLICQKITKALAFCFLTIMLIILSKSAAFIAKSLIPLTSAHTLFFGDAFLHIFPIALIFIQRFHLPKNLMVIVCLVLINICLIQDALALKIWKFGFEAEKMLLNRIMMRIEENPKFSNNKRYEIITIGSFPSYRPYYYEKTNEKIGSSSLLQGGYNRAWIVFFPEFKFGNSFGISGTLYRSLIKKIPGTFSQKAIDAVDRRYASALELVKYMREEIDNAQVWPSKNSIFVKDGIKDDMGIVIIILNERELDNIKQFIKKNGL